MTLCFGFLYSLKFKTNFEYEFIKKQKGELYMNTKIIKQTLAALIAIASFAATPGLAEAGSRKSHVAAKKKCNHKFITLGGGRKKVVDLSKKLFETADKEPQLKSNIINIIKNLSKKGNLYDQKLNIARFISSRIFSRKELYISQFREVVKLLAKCVDDEKAGRFVASCFDFIASEQLNVNLDFESVEKILKSLYKHENNEDSLISVIDGACFCGFFKNASHDKINDILNIFLKYTNINQVNDLFCEYIKPIEIKNFEKSCVLPQKHMVRVIARLNSDGCFKNHTQIQISNILDIFSHYFSLPVSGKDAIDVINDLIINDCFENCSQDNIIKLKNLLLNCSKYQNHEEDILTIIKNLIVNGCLKNCSQEVVSEIINMSLKFSDSEDGVEYFAYIVDALLNRGFLDGNLEADILNIQNKLAEWLENTNVQKCWISIISNLFNRGFLKKCQKNDISKIINGLAKCSENEKLKTNCAVFVSNFVNSDFLKNCDKGDMLQIKSILTNCVNDENSKKYVANVVQILLDRGFCQSEKNEISQVINLLDACSSSKEAESYILDSIHTLLNKELFTLYSADTFLNMPNDISVVEDLLQKYYYEYAKKSSSPTDDDQYQMPVESWDDQKLEYIENLRENLNKQTNNDIKSRLFGENLDKQTDDDIKSCLFGENLDKQTDNNTLFQIFADKSI